MKEYCIYNIWNGGTPFITKSYNTFQEAYNSLMIMIELEEKRNRIYFVDNDFFSNKYLPNLSNCKIFSIEVSEWRRMDDIKQQKNNSKIFYFNSIDFKREV